MTVVSQINETEALSQASSSDAPSTDGGYYSTA